MKERQKSWVVKPVKSFMTRASKLWKAKLPTWAIELHAQKPSFASKYLLHSYTAL